MVGKMQLDCMDFLLLPYTVVSIERGHSANYSTGTITNHIQTVFMKCIIYFLYFISDANGYYF